jgi:hypothetical protein
MVTHTTFERGVQLMGVHLEVGRDHRRHPGGPVGPGIPPLTGELEYLRLRPVDQRALHPLHADPPLLGLQHLVRGPRLHEGHGMPRTGGDRLAMLAQRVAHGAERRLGHRLHPGRPAASLPGAGLRALLGRIGIARPGGLDPGEVPAAVRLTLDPAGLLRPAHRGLAHPELPGERAITGRAHPYTGSKVKS